LSDTTPPTFSVDINRAYRVPIVSTTRDSIIVNHLRAFLGSMNMCWCVSLIYLLLEEDMFEHPR